MGLLLISFLEKTLEQPRSSLRAAPLQPDTSVSFSYHKFTTRAVGAGALPCDAIRCEDTLSRATVSARRRGCPGRSRASRRERSCLSEGVALWKGQKGQEAIRPISSKKAIFYCFLCFGDKAGRWPLWPFRPF